MASRVHEIIDTAAFLRFCEYYTAEFKRNNGFGRWLKEYQDMEARGLFKPSIVREMYKRILKGTFTLGFIRCQPFYTIGVQAQEAAQRYEDSHSGTYKICVFTGETAVDDDDDELVGLSYDEAYQICDFMNEEAEEELFIVKLE